MTPSLLLLFLRGPQKQGVKVREGRQLYTYARVRSLPTCYMYSTKLLHCEALHEQALQAVNEDRLKS